MTFDKLRLRNNNTKIVNAFYNISNTPDGQAGVLNFRLNYLVAVRKEQLRVKIYLQENQLDSEYSREVFATPIDYCKILEGAKFTVLFKAMGENFESAKQGNYSCPYAKNLTIIAINYIVTDKFFPPMPTEIRFKFVYQSLGLIEGRKSWTDMYAIAIFGRYKKVFGQ